MKRIDFLHGVIYLSFIILSPIALNVYLDEPTYIDITHENSFYRETTEPVRAYRTYRLYLLSVYSFLSIIIFSLLLDPIARRVSRLQIGCYRPHLIYHSMVSLIPVVIRYVNMNNEVQDDVMLQIQWKNLYIIILSVVRFICAFMISIARRYKLWRLLLYILITIVHAVIIFNVIYNLCSTSLGLLEVIKESRGNFLTKWSHVDHKQLPGNSSELNVSKMNLIYNFLSLDHNLFLKTGEKKYMYQSKPQLTQFKDRGGQIPPYQREVHVISTGESFSLSCSALLNGTCSVRVFWTSRGRNVTSISSQSKITTDFQRVLGNQMFVKSTLQFDAIKNSDFRKYSCSFHYEDFSSESFYYQNNKASAFMMDFEYLIGQYRIKKYRGENFFVYASPGSVVNLEWGPMSFKSERSDITQYYYVNGVPYSKEEKRENGRCSAFSYLYFLYGKAMKWFTVPEFSSSSDILLNRLDTYETHFLGCADERFFGVHRVDYLRRIYDEKSRAYIYIEVQHPDTLIVLPDQPYFLKMDNTTKADKEKIIRKIQQFNMKYTWFENTHKGILVVRLIIEVLILLFIIISLTYVLHKIWHFYTRCVIQPIRNVSLGSPILDKSESNIVEFLKEYSCYVVSCDNDKEVVYNSLVLPLREENIATGFIFEECNINKSGKSRFDIQSDIIKQCENLIFYVTSSYLKEEAFLGIHLDTVLQCIQMENISPNSVLIIFSDSCELPDKLRYNLPEAVIHDWIKSTDHKERLDLILKWIKKKKARMPREVVVSTVFLG
ncbi:uncharacterized protein LOC133190749 [Saccostrea echinata]|uniref:uncharacterized protein LOC133190749 n=1 Tax=Saccostrea echinata TaxID=191078 RepID=UPI002A83D307|nr:uncharacterized protein LOC133190749 [Saccostrea echinata]